MSIFTAYKVVWQKSIVSFLQKDQTCNRNFILPSYFKRIIL